MDRTLWAADAAPEFLSGFTPFAFDECGTFYLFDMHWPTIDGKYPIVSSDAACLGDWKWEHVD